MSEQRGTSNRGSAVLIDLENFLYGYRNLMSPDKALPLLKRALAQVPDREHCIAVAPSWVIGHYVRVLHELSIPSAVVAPGPDAADLALLEQAEHLASIGYQRFVVISGDHIFSSLCRAFPTTVIIRKNQPVARELKETAAFVLAA